MLSHMEKFLILLLLLLLLHTPPPNLQAHISALKPISQPQGLNRSLVAQIPLGLKLGFWPRGWNIGLEAEIYTWRLRDGEEGEGGEEISPYV